jgi:hypothetical protein
MQDFEIRILREDGMPAVLSTMKLYSAQSAIGAALRLARGRPFEVWSQERCVYSSIPSGGPGPSSPATMAA